GRGSCTAVHIAHLAVQLGARARTAWPRELHGRAHSTFGRATWCESAHGQASQGARPCKLIFWPCTLLGSRNQPVF
ncbi:unnamed protein product, partial [Linum tenue]